MLLGLGALLAITIIDSLTWRIRHDLPLSHYSAFMRVEYGTVPFAQLFELNFPGTVLLHIGIARVFGYGDRGLMLANLVWFVLLSGVTWKLLAPIARRVAWAGVLLFGVSYFGYGARMMLQRDCIIILPIALALLLHSQNRLRPWLRRVVVGALIGCAVVVKPHSGMALLPFLIADLMQPAASRLRSTAQISGAYFFGLAVPCALTLAWLAASGGLPAWLEMVREHLPLYLQLNGDHLAMDGGQRLRYVATNLRALGGHAGFLFAAGIGSFLALNLAQTSRSHRLVGLLLAQAAVFALYPAVSGQFWDYHYMPFVYVLALLSAHALLPVPETTTARLRLLPLLAFGATLFQVVHIADSVQARIAGQSPPTVKQGQVDEIADFLHRELRAGDTVQPLDWSGGVAHAMLIARAKLATPFLYDFHFYHQVSRPSVHRIRCRFLDDLRATRPRFIIEYFGDDKPWPRGPDTTREFPELHELIISDYRLRSTGLKYRIHERIS